MLCLQLRRAGAVPLGRALQESMKQAIFALIIIALVLAVWTRVSFTINEEFTYAGCTLGIGTGAIIGAASGNVVAGAAIGGSIGLMAGYLIGNSLRTALDMTTEKRREQQALNVSDKASAENARRGDGTHVR